MPTIQEYKAKVQERLDAILACAKSSLQIKLGVNFIDDSLDAVITFGKYVEFATRIEIDDGRLLVDLPVRAKALIGSVSVSNAAGSSAYGRRTWCLPA